MSAFGGKADVNWPQRMMHACCAPRWNFRNAFQQAPHGQRRVDLSQCLSGQSTYW